MHPLRHHPVPPLQQIMKQTGKPGLQPTYLYIPLLFDPAGTTHIATIQKVDPDTRPEETPPATTRSVKL